MVGRQRAHFLLLYASTSVFDILLEREQGEMKSIQSFASAVISNYRPSSLIWAKI